MSTKYKNMIVKVLALTITSSVAFAAPYKPVVKVEGVVDEGKPFVKVGTPYEIEGVEYKPKEVSQYDVVGIASWYGEKFHGKKTANGEIYDMEELTAAHPTLPLPSFVEVTNVENGKKIIVRVNDRGPFSGGRTIDLSKRSAELLDFKGKGTANVRIRLLAEISKEAAVELNKANLELNAHREILSQQLSSVDKASPASSIKGDVDLIKPVDYI